MPNPQPESSPWFAVDQDGRLFLLLPEVKATDWQLRVWNAFSAQFLRAEAERTRLAELGGTRWNLPLKVHQLPVPSHQRYEFEELDLKATVPPPIDLEGVLKRASELVSNKKRENLKDVQQAYAWLGEYGRGRSPEGAVSLWKSAQANGVSDPAVLLENRDDLTHQQRVTAARDFLAKTDTTEKWSNAQAVAVWTFAQNHGLGYDNVKEARERFLAKTGGFVDSSWLDPHKAELREARLFWANTWLSRPATPENLVLDAYRQAVAWGLKNSEEAHWTARQYAGGAPFQVTVEPSPAARKRLQEEGSERFKWGEPYGHTLRDVLTTTTVFDGRPVSTGVFGVGDSLSQGYGNVTRRTHTAKPAEGPTVNGSEEQKDDLETWWLDSAAKEVEPLLAKALEYGGDLARSQDLVDVGRSLVEAGVKVPDDGDGWTDKELEEFYAELGVYFYAKSKLSRWAAAVNTGRRPSDDTLLDLGVYARMAQRIRHSGGFPA